MTPAESRKIKSQICKKTDIAESDLKKIMTIVIDHIRSKEEVISNLKSGLAYYAEADMYQGGKKSFISQDKGAVAREVLGGECIK